MRFIYVLISCCSFLYACAVFAQPDVNRNMESYVNRISLQEQKNLSRLTKYLTQPYGDEYEKAMAIAYYLASHMAYDEYLYKNTHSWTQKIRPRKNKTILKNKAGIGSDFAALFVAMCQKAGVKAYIQKGFVLKENEKLTPLNRQEKGHVWNYFMYKGRKVYVDTAFMSGGRSGDPTFIVQSADVPRSRKQNEIFANKIYPIRSFYFDFNYDAERQLHQLNRVER